MLEKRPRGRPRKVPRPVISGRVSQELYDRLSSLAEESNRSLSEEFAYQAERSLDRREVNVVRMLSRISDQLEKLTQLIRERKGVE